MGQYYKIVNLDKKEYIRPLDMDHGSKLLEFGCDSIGPMTSLAILMSDGNGRGGGDLRVSEEEEYPDGLVEMIGSWAGDRVVITGDYADQGKFILEGLKEGDELPEANVNLYDYVEKDSSGYRNISGEALALLCMDKQILRLKIEQFKKFQPEGLVSTPTPIWKYLSKKIQKEKKQMEKEWIKERKKDR